MNILSRVINKDLNWNAIILSTLAFWFCSSLFLDFILIPSLSVSGMMNDGGFANVGFLIFGVFNRIEVICAALILTVSLVFYFNHQFPENKQTIFLVFANLLLLIALAYTYIFIPHMSAWGLSINQFSATTEMPHQMISWHEGYWVLEAIKYLLVGNLLRWCYSNTCPVKN
ncbi:MAG: hypothetical protein ACXITR_10730 [Cyanobacterium sp.]